MTSNRCLPPLEMVIQPLLDSPSKLSTDNRQTVPRCHGNLCEGCILMLAVSHGLPIAPFQGRSL